MDQHHGNWVILIEENGGGGQGIHWRASLADAYYPTRESARSAALQCAQTYRPRHPMNQNNRSVVRHDADNYSVIIEGSTRRFHFRVSVGEHLN